MDCTSPSHVPLWVSDCLNFLFNCSTDLCKGNHAYTGQIYVISFFDPAAQGSRHGNCNCVRLLGAVVSPFGALHLVCICKVIKSFPCWRVYLFCPRKHKRVSTPPILMLDSFTSGLILTQSCVVYRLYTSLRNHFLCSSTIGELFQFSRFVLPRRIQIRSLRILQVCNAFSLTAIHCTNVCEAIPLLSTCFAGIFPHSPPGHSHPPSFFHPQSVDS